MIYHLKQFIYEGSYSNLTLEMKDFFTKIWNDIKINKNSSLLSTIDLKFKKGLEDYIYSQSESSNLSKSDINSFIMEYD